MADRDSDKRKTQYGLGQEDYYQVAEMVEANMERRRAERENKKKKKVPKKPLFILALIVTVIGLFIFSFTNFFVVDSIEVEGNKYFSDEEIVTMAHAAPGRNLIYHPGKSSIKEYLKQNPYIEEVKVRRSLPSTLVIEVKERQQLGAIVYDDDYLIIDGNGILLRKTQTTPKITIIKGITVKKLALGEEVKTENERVFNDALKLLASMQENDLYFIRLEMSDMYIKAYIYDYLVCKGTYEQLESSMSKGRLHKILNNLFQKSIKRGTITFSDDGYASFKPSIE